jgi:hypothetical protein
MKRVTSFAFSYGLLIVILAMTCRLFWHSWHTETGFTTLRLQWYEAALGLASVEREPLASQRPVKQAEFWLAETERILKQNPDDINMMVGAALLLDRPSPKYRLPKGENRTASERAFESLCRDRCLELISTATAKEPENVEWWRLRALLIYPGGYSDVSVQKPNWRELLDECHQHDPDNALYDYIAANILWKASSKQVYVEHLDQIEVKDAENFALACEYFERGLEKPYFRVGDVGYQVALQIVGESKLLITEYPNYVSGDRFSRKGEIFLTNWRWQEVRARSAEIAGEFQVATELRRENLRTIEQFSQAKNGQFRGYARDFRVKTASRMNELARTQPTAFSGERKSEFVAIENTARLRSEVAKEVNRIELQQAVKKWKLDFPNQADLTIVYMAVSFLPAVTILLMILGASSATISRAADNSAVRVGPFQQIFMMFCSLAITGVLFGLFPAGYVGGKAQAEINSNSLIAVAIIILMWAGWTWLRRNNFRFGLRAILILTFALAVLFGLSSAARLFTRIHSGYPLVISIPALGFNEISPENLKWFLGNKVTWRWVLAQWFVYGGHYISIAIWMVFVTVRVFAIKSRWNRNDEATEARGLRYYLAVWFGSLGKPALAWATLTLLGYLALSPLIVDCVDCSIQRELAFARNPDKYWDDYHQRVADLESDPLAMVTLQKRVVDMCLLAKEAQLEREMLEQERLEAEETEVGEPDIDFSREHYIE